ncbi:MAG: magnesium transporter [Alcaligenaceae bacterium]|nr:magnesium transporter [Alcaligenaceae bacterium]
MTNLHNKDLKSLEQEDTIEDLNLDTDEIHLMLQKVRVNLQKLKQIDENLQETNAPEVHASLVTLQEEHEQSFKDYLKTLHPADIAVALESFNAEEREIIWEYVSPEDNADVLLEVNDWIREELISQMDKEELYASTEDLDVDELADLVEDLPDDVISEISKSLSEDERNKLQEVLKYPEDTVGAMMDMEVVCIQEHETIDAVLHKLRQLGELPENTDQVFIVNNKDRLQGVISLEKLLLNEPDKVISEVMRTEYFTLNPHDHEDEAESAFERYDFLSVPVVDKQNRLVGRVTIADVVDVIRESSEEEQLSRAGLQEDDFLAPLKLAIRNRSPWLFVNLCTCSVASFIAAQFEFTVSQVVVLAFLMTIVNGVGGSVGNQTMTLVIRALATGHIDLKQKTNILRLLRHELSITMLVGLCGGLLAFLLFWLFSHSFKISLVVCLALIGNMINGAFFGVLVPITRHHFGKDPAIGSTVLLTFMTDSIGFLFTLGLASLFLL